MRVSRSNASTHTITSRKSERGRQRFVPRPRLRRHRRRSRRQDLDFRWEQTMGGPYHLETPILTDREIKAQRPMRGSSCMT